MDNQTVLYRIAVATSDGIVVNQHFGRAARFRIYDIGQESDFRFVEERVMVPVCETGNHDDARLKENAAKLSDCRYVLVSRIGQGAANALEQEGISPMELPGMIEESIRKLTAYEKIQRLFM